MVDASPLPPKLSLDRPSRPPHATEGPPLPTTHPPAASKGGKKPAGGAAGVGAKSRASAAAHRDYDPLAPTSAEGASWAPGKPVPFLFLARTFEAISETTKRLEIQTLLCNCFRTIIATTPEDLLPAVYLSSSAARREPRPDVIASGGRGEHASQPAPR